VGCLLARPGRFVVLDRTSHHLSISGLVSRGLRKSRIFHRAADLRQTIDDDVLFARDLSAVVPRSLQETRMILDRFASCAPEIDDDFDGAIIGSDLYRLLACHLISVEFLSIFVSSSRF
jgi:hypothetical protein